MPGNSHLIKGFTKDDYKKAISRPFELLAAVNRPLTQKDLQYFPEHEKIKLLAEKGFQTVDGKIIKSEVFMEKFKELESSGTPLLQESSSTSSSLSILPQVEESNKKFSLKEILNQEVSLMYPEGSQEYKLMQKAKNGQFDSINNYLNKVLGSKVFPSYLPPHTRTPLNFSSFADQKSALEIPSPSFQTIPKTNFKYDKKVIKQLINTDASSYHFNLIPSGPHVGKYSTYYYAKQSSGNTENNLKLPHPIINVDAEHASLLSLRALEDLMLYSVENNLPQYAHLYFDFILANSHDELNLFNELDLDSLSKGTKQLNYLPTIHTWAAKVSACASEGYFEEALSILNHLQFSSSHALTNSYIHDIILKNLLKFKEYELMDSFWLRMLSETNLKLSYDSYNTYMKRHAAEGGIERALFLYEEANIKLTNALPNNENRVANLINDEEMFITLLDAASKSPTFLEPFSNIVDEILDRAMGAGIVPTLDFYNAIILAYANQNDPVAAEYYYWEMKRKGIEPNDRTISILLSAYGNVQSVPGLVLPGSKPHLYDGSGLFKPIEVNDNTPLRLSPVYKSLHRYSPIDKDLVTYSRELSLMNNESYRDYTRLTKAMTKLGSEKYARIYSEMFTSEFVSTKGGKRTKVVMEDLLEEYPELNQDLAERIIFEASLLSNDKDELENNKELDSVTLLQTSKKLMDNVLLPAVEKKTQLNSGLTKAELLDSQLDSFNEQILTDKSTVNKVKEVFGEESTQNLIENHISMKNDNAIEDKNDFVIEDDDDEDDDEFEQLENTQENNEYSLSLLEDLEKKINVSNDPSAHPLLQQVEKVVQLAKDPEEDVSLLREKFVEVEQTLSKVATNVLSNLKHSVSDNQYNVVETSYIYQKLLTQTPPKNIDTDVLFESIKKNYYNNHFDNLKDEETKKVNNENNISHFLSSSFIDPFFDLPTTYGHVMSQTNLMKNLSNEDQLKKLERLENVQLEKQKLLSSIDSDSKEIEVKENEIVEEKKIDLLKFHSNYSSLAVPTDELLFTRSDIRNDFMTFGRPPANTTSLVHPVTRNAIFRRRADMLLSNYLSKINPENYNEVSPNIWRNYISIFAEGGKVKETNEKLNFFSNNKDIKFSHHHELTNSMVKMHIRNKKPLKAVKLLQEIRQTQLKMKEKIKSLPVSQKSKAIIQYDSLTPNPATFGLLIQTFSHHKMYEDAIKIWEQCHNDNIKIGDRYLDNLRRSLKNMGYKHDFLPIELPNQWVEDVKTIRKKTKLASKSKIQRIDGSFWK